MGYTAAPGQNGRIRGVRFEEAAPVVMPLVAKKKAPKTETGRISDTVLDDTLLASAQVESMSPTHIKKIIENRRHNRCRNDLRGKAHREHTKYKMGRHV